MELEAERSKLGEVTPMRFRTRSVIGIALATAMAGASVFLVSAGLRRNNAKNVALAKLAEFDAVTSTFYGSEISDCWRDCCGFENWGVEIRLSRFDDEDLQELAPLLSETSGIIFFGVAGTRITDAGCETLSHMRHIQILDLSGTSVTSHGVERLRVMPRLASLKLRNTRVDDSVIPTLVALHSLKYVDLENTRVSDQGVSQLLSLRQDVRVSWAGWPRVEAGVKP